ncbi:MAG: segregation/condensation protein A [Bacteroidota bacterium]|nr:segregation/condensation protein A [Bacteroidota bacterium]MDE2956780.1 segregation/condensation protein A [Bacteroidota bacterium]
MYEVRLRDFEGPLDLLLFLIQREEVDIFDIPVARITDEYLAYVNAAVELDLDSVADFIYLASMLIRIKARMLLPRPELDEQGELIDPRQALIEQLLEYVRYKDAAGQLGQLQSRRERLFTRGEASRPFQPEVEDAFVNTTVYDLVGALRRVLQEDPEEPQVTVNAIDYTVAKQREFVVGWVRVREAGRFANMVSGYSKGFAIATFLAVLELAQQGTVTIEPDYGHDDFIIAAVNGRADGGN